MVPRVQPEGAAQERIADYAEAAGSPLYEAPAEGHGEPTGAVPFYPSNKTDTKGATIKIQPQKELMGPVGQHWFSKRKMKL